MATERRFAAALLDAAKVCKEEFGYNPTYLLRMIGELGAVGAAKRLLCGARTSDGFSRLWQEGRLDLSVEFLALLPDFADLFADDERAEARHRLEFHAFDVDRNLHAHQVIEERDT